MIAMRMNHYGLVMLLRVHVLKEISLVMQMRKYMGFESEYFEVKKLKLLIIAVSILLLRLLIILMTLETLQFSPFSNSIYAPTAHSG